MSLWVPKADKGGLAPSSELANDWEVVNDPVEVEKNIIEQSKRHFHQSQGTPFTVPPLNQINSPTDNRATEIMQSGLPQDWTNVTPVGWNDETSHFIDRLQLEDKIPKIETTISMKDFTTGIKRWKERTTTSPSGWHLGHLYVLLALDGSLTRRLMVNPRKISRTRFYECTCE